MLTKLADHSLATDVVTLAVCQSSSSPLLNTHLHVLRADCWCSSTALTTSARCAWRSLTPCHQPSRTLVRTLDDVCDGFLLRLLGVSLWPCPGCANSRCASCTLLDLHVPLRFSRSWCFLLRSAKSHPSQIVCEDPPFDHSFSISPKGYNFAVHVSSTMACLMLSRHHSLCSLISAFVCAVLHTFLEFLPAGCTRGYASSAHREHSVHHCLWLKALFCLWLSLPPVPLCGSSPLRGRLLWHL